MPVDEKRSKTASARRAPGPARALVLVVAFVSAAPHQRLCSRPGRTR